MAEAEVKTFWQRQRLAEAEVENPHTKVHILVVSYQECGNSSVTGKDYL